MSDDRPIRSPSDITSEWFLAMFNADIKDEAKKYTPETIIEAYDKMPNLRRGELFKLSKIMKTSKFRQIINVA